MTAYFNMNRPKESGIEVYEEDLPENQGKDESYNINEEEQSNERPKFSGKKSFMMLSKEEREAKARQSERTAKSATKPVGPVKIGKKIYEKGKAAAEVPGKIKEGAKDLFLSKKQKEELRIRKKAFEEREKAKKEEKYKSEAKAKLGETFEESQTRIRKQNEETKKFNLEIQKEQEEKRKNEKRMEREEKRKVTSKATLEKIKAETKLAKSRLKREESESREPESSKIDYAN